MEVEVVGVLFIIGIGKGFSLEFKSSPSDYFGNTPPTNTQYEVNVELTSENEKKTTPRSHDVNERRGHESQGPSFFREHFLTIFLGSCALVMAIGFICFLRWRERKYGDPWASAYAQKRIDIRNVRCGPTSDVEGYRQSVDRLRDSKDIVGGDILLLGRGKGAAMVKIQQPEAEAGVFNGYRPPLPSTSTKPFQIQCKSKCAGGDACGGGGGNPRGAAKRQGYEMVRETYRPA